MHRSLILVSTAVAFVCASAAHAHTASPPTLVVDNSFSVDSVDPHRAFDPTSVLVDRAVYDTLFTYRNGDMSHPVPLLVQSWSTKNAKTFTFQLKRNVHFGDGTPLTSADVVFSLRRLVNLKGNPSFFLAGVTVSAAGPYTVVARATTPEAQLPSILASAETGIVNAKLARAHGASDAANASRTDTAERWFNSAASAGAGSGPYQLASYDPTSQITLRPNPRYWRTKKPAFGSIVLRNMAAPAQAINIRRGAHQVAVDISSDQAISLEGNARLRVTRQPSPFTFYAFTNDDPTVSPVTSNPHFQQAVRLALDYAAIRSVAGPGTIQAAGLIPSMLLGALPQKDALMQDLARARAELAASGVGDQQVTLEYPSDLTINGVSFATLAQKTQANLEAAGIKVALAGSPAAVFQPRFRANRVALGLWLWAPDFQDPADYLVFAPGGLVALHAGWPAGSDAATEQLASRARVATGTAQRAALYRRFQLALNARSPFIPLIQPTQVFVATTDLTAARFSGAYDVDVTQIAPR